MNLEKIIDDDALSRHTISRQIRSHVRIYALDILHGNCPFRHAGLICDDEQIKAFAETAKRRYRIAEKDYLRRIGQIAEVLDDGAITVQKHCGTRSVFCLPCSSRGHIPSANTEFTGCRLYRRSGEMIRYVVLNCLTRMS